MKRSVLVGCAIAVALISGPALNAYLAHKDSQTYQRNLDRVVEVESKPATIEAQESNGHTSYEKCHAGWCTSAPSLADLEDAGPQPGTGGGIPVIDSAAFQGGATPSPGQAPELP